MSAREWRLGGGRQRTQSFTGPLTLNQPLTRLPSVRTPEAPRPIKSFPERIDADAAVVDLFDLDEGTAGAFGAAGQLPAQVYETPFAAADVGLRLLTGGRINEGQVEGGFSPLGFLGSLPGVAGAATVADEGLRRAGNFMPAVINARDAQVWSAVAGLPDDTPITPDLLSERGVAPIGTLGPLATSPELRGGFLGIGSRPTTVKEFRDELHGRGFFFDETSGEELDPAAVADEIRSGRRSQHSFGFAAINDNALVDLAGRLALDPTNALFLVPGANLAKLGHLGARLLPASRLVRAGAITRQAPKAVEVAEAVTQGRRIVPTLAGIGRVFRAYRTGSVGLSAGNFGVNLAAEANLLPFSEEIAEFTQAVQERRPMSGNAAFMLFSAATFPYGPVARATGRAAGAAKTRVLGHSDTAAFHREYGGRRAFEEAFGGPDGVRELVDFIDVQIARERKALTPREVAEIANIGDIALRRKIESQALARAVEKMRRDRSISADDRLGVFQDWHSKQAGFEGTLESGAVVDRGFRNPWDPGRAASRWNAWKPVRAHLKRVLDDTGEVIWGLRDDVIFHEQIDTARALLRPPKVNGKVNPKASVDPALIRQVLEDNPNFNLLDKGDFWNRFGDPKAEAPTWETVSRKLAAMRRQNDAVHISEYTADLTRWEQSAPPDPVAPDLPIRSVDEMDAARAQRTAELDAKSGADPATAKALDDALTQDRMLGPARLHAGIRRMDPETVQRVAELEAEIIKINPSYRVKRAPNDVLALVPEDAPIGVALRQHRALGTWLTETGPFSPIAKFWHTMTRPVTRDELARGTRTALMNELRPLGLRTVDVDRVVSALDQRVKESVLVSLPGGAKVRLHRDIASLLPSQVAEIVARTLNEGRPKKIGPHPAIGRIEEAGGMYRVLSRASSRYARTIQERARKGAPISKKLDSIYDVWGNTPAGTAQRVIAKFVYPLVRFTLDPRWLALNAIEANILALSKHGYLRAYNDLAQGSRASRFFAGQVDEGLAPSLAPDAGWALTRELQTYAAKSFDVDSIASVEKVLNDYGANHPALTQLRASMRAEAAEELARAQKLHDAGDITQRQYEAQVSRAEKLQRASNEDLAQLLNDKLYAFETEGVEAAVGAEARSVLSREDLDVLRRSGLLDRIHEVNRQSWDDVQRVFKGNPERSTLERLANSYWLYWPISYQIKATRWLLDVMLNGSFGHNNHALLAGRYALVLEEHQQRMTNNPAYAAMYESHPTLWFAAQMLLPMAPGDIGVSLSRATRQIGAEGQSFLNEWLGTEIGVFTAEKASEDPAAAIAWQTNLGAQYTFELASRLINEADDVRTAPSDQRLTPPTERPAPIVVPRLP